MVSKAHFKRLSNGLRELWEEDYLTDTEITTHDIPVKLHKVILLIFSTFNKVSSLKSMSTFHVSSNSSEVQTFLKFLYDGEANIKPYFPDMIKKLNLDLKVSEDVKKERDKQENSDLELRYLRDLTFEHAVSRLSKDGCPGSDIVLKTGKKLHKCHKVILAAVSSYFKAMFVSGMKETEDNVISLERIDPHIFSLILQYIYSGNITVNVANVQDLLSTSCYLQISHLQAPCEEFLMNQIDSSNCVDIWNLGVFFSILDIQNRAKAYMVEHFTDLSKTQLINLPWTEFVALINDDNLNSLTEKPVLDTHEGTNVSNETEVLKFLLCWLPKAKLTMDNTFELLCHIRFSFISKDFIKQLLTQNSVIMKSSACTELLKRALEAPNTNEKPRNEKTLLVLKGSATTTKLDVVCYSFQQNKWFRFHSAQTLCGTAFAVCVSSSSKDLYLTGGSAHPKSCHHFSVEENKWATKADMNEGRSSHGVGFVDGKVYVLGGFNAYVNFDSNGSIEKYDTKTDTWKVVCQLQIPTYDSACSVVKSKIYLFGGTMTVIPGSYVKDVQCFDTETDTCSVVYHNLPMPLSIGVAVACSDNRDVYIVCPRGDIIHYREDSPPTVIHSPGENGRMGFGVVCFDNKIYVMGGYSQTSSNCINSFYDLRKKIFVASKMKLPFDNRPHQLFATVANISRGYLKQEFSLGQDYDMILQQSSR